MIGRDRYRGGNFLDVIPVRRSDVVQEEDESGCVTLSRPRSRSSMLTALAGVLKKSRYVQFTLDVPGTAVWKRIDGRRTIAGLAAEAGRDGLDGPSESEYLRLAQFVRSLQRQGLVRLELPGHDRRHRQPVSD